MASYLAQTRSNHFRVRSPAAFRRFCRRYALTVFNGTERGRNCRFGFLADERIPSGRIARNGEWIETDFFGELAKQLARGEVAVVIEVGHEKMRYLVGYAGAVNGKGERVQVALNEIYHRAQKTFGIEPSLAEY